MTRAGVVTFAFSYIVDVLIKNKKAGKKPAF
jgi:hypothetical protein